MLLLEPAWNGQNWRNKRFSKDENKYPRKCTKIQKDEVVLSKDGILG